MELITLRCLLARGKNRTGVTSSAGKSGLARKVDRVQGLSGLAVQQFSPALLPTTLLVIAAATSTELDTAPGERRRKFLESLQASGLPCLALAGVDKIPDFLVRFAERTSTFVFGSRFDEHLLTSRLLSLLREKLYRRFFVQGALVNVRGRGVLITGESGAGKTTLALELARRGHTWIADDAVEIEKHSSGRLSGRNRTMVKDLVEIKGIGVLPVRDVLPAANIADETSVEMIAKMRRDARPCVSRTYGGKSVGMIMGIRLPLLKIPWSKDRDGQRKNAARIIRVCGAAVVPLQTLKQTG